MKNEKNKTKKWLNLNNVRLNYFVGIWLLAPIFIWFSYWPLIHFAQNSTMNFELSIALIYVAILAIASLPQIWRARKELVKNKAVWLVGAFLICSGITLFWDANLTRGILTFGILGLLFLIFLGAISAREIFAKIGPVLAKILVMSAIIMGIFAVAQMVAGIYFSRNETLLCAGCVAGQFGFVRPNVFAIEPQFFGSLLLAPILIILQSFFSKKLIIFRGNFAPILALFFLTLVLILTLSRGAIFAFAIGAMIIFVANFRELKRIFISVLIMILGLVFALIFQGFCAAINPNLNDNFTNAISRSVSQLSMSLINLPMENSTENSEENQDENSAPAFDGYVAESTDVRVNLSRLALKTWAQNSRNIWFGVGLGGAGVAMADYAKNNDSREIVQNEFAEILLERGIVGLVIFVGVLAGFFAATCSRRWLWAIAIAFLVQWNFFSGLPNALHIYLILVVIFASVISHRDRSEPAKKFSR